MRVARLQGLLGLALLCLLIACNSPAKGDRPTSDITSAQSNKVRTGVAGLLSDAGIYIAIEKGYFRDQGVEISLERLGSGADQVALLNSGQIDTLGGGTSLALYNAIERGAQFRVVADKGNTPSSEWDYIALAVRKDLVDSGRVRTFADLRGLTVTASGIGNTTEVALFSALALGGLNQNDVTHMALPYGDLASAFSSYSIDAAIAGEPFMSQLESQGLAVRFAGNSELMDRYQQVAVVAFSQQFAARSDLARRWMVAYVRGVRDYNDAFGPKQRDREQIIDMLVRNTSVKERDLYARMRPPGLHPDGKLDLDYIRFELDYYGKAGTIQLSQVVDTLFQEYAFAQLGPYTP